MSIQPLLDYFTKFLPLDEKEAAFLTSVFKERKVRRRQFILQEGDICKFNTFVVEGCFKMYMVDEKGKEHNLQFAVENWWIGDIGSFHSEKPSKLYIEALLNVYKQSLNTSDAALAQSLYTKNGIFMPTEAPSAVGSDNILKAYEFVFSQIQLNIEFFIEEIEVDQDMAFAVTSSKGTTLIHATGDTVLEANRELFVFEKVEGEWKIARYMFNKTEPRQ